MSGMSGMSAVGRGPSPVPSLGTVGSDRYGYFDGGEPSFPASSAPSAPFTPASGTPVPFAFSASGRSVPSVGRAHVAEAMSAARERVQALRPSSGSASRGTNDGGASTIARPQHQRGSGADSLGGPSSPIRGRDLSASVSVVGTGLGDEQPMSNGGAWVESGRPVAAFSTPGARRGPGDASALTQRLHLLHEEGDMLLPPTWTPSGYPTSGYPTSGYPTRAVGETVGRATPSRAAISANDLPATDALVRSWAKERRRRREAKRAQGARGDADAAARAVEEASSTDAAAHQGPPGEEGEHEDDFASRRLHAVRVARDGSFMMGIL